MIHPLDPRSPQYPELVEAGRAPAGGYGQVVEVDPLSCAYWYEDRQGEQVCGEPAVHVVSRSDGQGVTIRLCDRDVSNFAGALLPGGVTFVVSRLGCSSCDETVSARYELDASGRCDGCRP